MPGSGRLAIYRVAARGELGPGCYVLKTVQQGSDASIGLALLKREAAVAAQVAHPGLTAILSSDFSAAQSHLLFPYHDGLTLRRMLDVKSALPVAYALSVARQIAAALASLHDAGWLHGQIRPRHVIVSPQGQTTLIDLTLARRQDTSECNPGTNPLASNSYLCALYSAPEFLVARGRLTAASDMHSLGLVLFEALAGQPPFPRLSLRHLISAHRTAAPPDLRLFRPSLSLEIAQLVRRTLAKEPLRRPSAKELEQWLAELEIEDLAS